MDGILQAQATADAGYFVRHRRHRLQRRAAGRRSTRTVLKAYRWQYIVSGVMEPRFQKVLFALVDEAQGARIQAALAPLSYAVPQQPAMPLPMAA